MLFTWVGLFNLIWHPALAQVTRDYDEEEQGYDSEKEKKEEQNVSESGTSPKLKELAQATDKGSTDIVKESKVNGDDHHEEDMDMSE